MLCRFNLWSTVHKYPAVRISVKLKSYVNSEKKYVLIEVDTRVILLLFVIYTHTHKHTWIDNNNNASDVCAVHKKTDRRRRNRFFFSVWRIFCVENYGRNVYIVIMWRPAHWSNIKGVFVFVFQSAGGHIIAVELFFPVHGELLLLRTLHMLVVLFHSIHNIYNKNKLCFSFFSSIRFRFFLFFVVDWTVFFFKNVFIHSKKQRQTNMTEK